MKKMRTSAGLSSLAISLAWIAAPAAASTQEVTSQSNPAALGLTDAESLRAFDQEPLPPKGAPNVIYILLDDTGFADLGSYGSEIHTPNIDALASEGLRFNNFNSRAICSPTRAALLSGRNSHTVGMAVTINSLSGFPNGQGRVSHSAASIAEILQMSGYRTYAVGKWHLAPITQTSSREYWPVRSGFDQFYGFLEGMTDQYYPDIVVDNTPTVIKNTQDYHVSVDLTDHAIGYVAAEKAASPDRPFFLYLAYGATHAPHQVPASYIKKYADTYTKGWDAIRQERFNRQKALGLIPKSAQLSSRNPEVRAWADLSPDERQLNARFQAAYAGFLEHTDEQIGRLVDFLRKSGQLDNTMIVLISDNGGSVEGHETGTLNEVSSINGIHEKPSEMAKRIDEIGSKTTYANYPSGWAQVSNTPFQFYKTTLWDGGTRTPLIIRYPQLIKDRDKGTVRSQFVDAIDVTPTVLDIVGIKAPAEYNGVAQLPLHGASFKSNFSDAAAPAARSTQYFEMLGQRAIWHNGWRAISEHSPGADFAKDKWHLYNIDVDFSAVKDVAVQYPDILENLKTRWWAEAGKYGVLPLVNASLWGSFSTDKTKATVPPYKTSRDPRPEYIFYPQQVELIRTDAPQIGTGSYNITAELSPSTGNEQGVIIADGDRFGGYSLYVKDGYLKFEQSDLGNAFTTLTATEKVGKGVRNLRYQFDRSDQAGGIGKLFYDNREVASGPIRMRSTSVTSVASFSVGFDTSGPVSETYPDNEGFRFTGGKLERVVVRKMP